MGIGVQIPTHVKSQVLPHTHTCSNPSAIAGSRYVCVRARTCICLCTFMCVYVWIGICVCANSWPSYAWLLYGCWRFKLRSFVFLVGKCTYQLAISAAPQNTHTHTHTHTYTHIYVYMHTHILALGLASRTWGMRGKYSCYATILNQLYIKPQDLTICFFPSSFILLTNIFFDTY